MKLVFVSISTPSAVGHGGYHRTYQILYDLEQLVGKDNVHFIGAVSRNVGENSSGAGASPYATSLAKMSNATVSRFAKFFFSSEAYIQAANFCKAVFGIKSSFDRHIMREYKAYLSQTLADPENANEIVCVIEHPRLVYLEVISRPFNVPIVFCPQNIESLESQYFVGGWSRRTTASFEFRKEIDAWRRCASNLMISKSETSLVRGLGLTSDYYPYFPVGEIRDRAVGLRKKRLESDIVAGLFLVIGSGGHKTTKASLEWMLGQIEEFGLPAGIRLVIVGSQTDKLLPSDTVLDNVETLGWVEQPILDRLTETVCGVLVCQNSGFGSVTRIVEFACANLPVIVSEHASYAIDIPPEVYPVKHNWEDWCDVMSGIASRPLGLCKYDEWQKDAGFSLEKSIKMLVDTR